MNMLKRFIRDESGLELSEYAVMVGLIVILVVGAITLLSGAIQSAFERTAGIIDGGGAPPAP